MADKPLFLRIWDRLRKRFVFTPWPMNSLGRPYGAFMANVMFEETSNPQVFDAIPDGATDATSYETEGLQGATNQGNKTVDWVETGGYAMESFPVANTPTRIPIIQQKSLPYYNQDNVTRELLAGMTPEAFAAFIKPYLNSTTPGTGPVLATPLADVTFNQAGTVVIPANTFTGVGLTYTVTKEDGTPLPFQYNSLTRTISVPATAVNGDTEVKVTATDSAGQSNSTTFTITVAFADSLPNVQSIVRKYDPSIKTVYYFLKSSYQGTDLAKIPVYRCKNSTETNWRSDWSSTLEASAFTDYNNGYRTYAYANLSITGQTTTTTVFQFKPYPSAPDSSIIEFVYTLPNAQDYGTEVYRYSTNSAKIYDFYVARIGTSQFLCCYADGVGTLKTTLVATGSTPVYPNGEQVMSTDGGPFSVTGLFDGTRPKGSLYRNVVNGTYIVSIIDEDGVSQSYPITVTDNAPISALKVRDTSGGGTFNPDGYRIGGFLSV